MPATTSAGTDPRSVITPDAFAVSEDLLGLPLASPRRRFAALLIDLAVIGVITLVTRSFALILGVVAAGFFIRVGFKRTPVGGSVFGRAMRASVGCLGLLIALLTAVIWASCGVDSSDGRRGDVGDFGPRTASATSQIFAALAAAGLSISLEDAETVEEAESAVRQLVELGQELGLEDDDLRDFLMNAVPPEAPWASEAEPMIERFLGLGEPTVGTDVVEVSVAEEVTLEEALVEYATLVGSETADDAVLARRRALATVIADEVAVDTMAALASRIGDLERRNRNQQEELEDTNRALAEARSGGVFAWIRDFADELGFGFGWASLYMTILLSGWRGQTVGKKLMGVRVLRLDGKPITWWIAFERAGGYAAGFATGLLGFAQVYWDANRQAIHDRIVGTVVVYDGADKIIDWRSAT